MNDMNERVALVTGGTRGIGAAISTHLAQHGAKIAAVYNRNTEAADAFAKEAIDLIPMHALGKPDDVAEAVRYLVSDEAHYLTGALIPVAGGLLMM